MSADLKHHEYLGDAVYASTDGFHIWLHVGDHRTRPVVALEPEILASLNRYAEKLAAMRKEEIANPAQ